MGIVLLFLVASVCQSTVSRASADQQEARLASLEDVVQHVLAENAELTEKLARLQTELADQQNQKAELVEKVSELERLVEELKTDQEVTDENDYELEADDDETELDEFSFASDRKRQLNSAWVGFTAVISPADVTHLTPGQPIIFDQAITNMGDAYNTSTGKFTTPTRGTYVFNMDILVEQGENEYLQFVKDGKHVMYNYAHAQGSLHDVSSSRLVVLELNKGNQVWVQTAPNSHHGSGNVHGNGFSTFSGWLQQIIEEPPTAVVGK